MNPGFTRMMLIWPALLLAVTGAWGADQKLKPVTLLPQWVPQAQFAGYYTALEKGFYRSRGIDLTIIDGGPERPAGDFLKGKRADFVTLWLSTALQMRDQGVRVVNIGQVSQRSALMMVAFKKSGILHPSDMNKKRVGLWGEIFRIQPEAFFRKYNLDVTVIPQSYSIHLFLRGGVDVASCMWYNEYHTLLNAGVNPDELIPFFFHEHDLNYPEDGIYTLEETWRRDPGLCHDFAAASMAGWQYAFDHVEEALDLIMIQLKKAHIPATRVHQRWMLERMRDLILPSDRPGDMGCLSQKDFDRVTTGLKQNALIRESPPFSDFYRGECRNDEK